MRTHRKAVQPRFVEPVLLGYKRTTIRPMPRLKTSIPQEGDTIELYRWTGKPYRSKQDVIGRFRVACDACPVEVHEACVIVDRESETPLVWSPNAERGDANLFARWEGFGSWEGMVEWFREAHGLPFRGLLIQWEPKNLGYEEGRK